MDEFPIFTEDHPVIARPGRRSTSKSAPRKYGAIRLFWNEPIPNLLDRSRQCDR